jgi:hypothetical protein
MILACYWLADHYHQHPDTFLALTPGEVVSHMTETQRMLKLKNRKT